MANAAPGRSRSTPRAVLGVLLLAWWVGGCAPAERPCVRGDQTACQCGDGTYGYRTCVPAESGGQATEYGGCDCVIGLSPDGGMMQSPYTSGRGTGAGDRDASGQ